MPFHAGIARTTYGRVAGRQECPLPYAAYSESEAAAVREKILSKIAGYRPVERMSDEQIAAELSRFANPNPNINRATAQ
jgi:hypothetical protein